MRFARCSIRLPRGPPNILAFSVAPSGHCVSVVRTLLDSASYTARCWNIMQRHFHDVTDVSTNWQPTLGRRAATGGCVECCTNRVVRACR